MFWTIELRVTGPTQEPGTLTRADIDNAKVHELRHILTDAEASQRHVFIWVLGTLARDMWKAMKP